MAPDQFDRARELIQKQGFSSQIETKIALFLCAAKNVNAMYLGACELQPSFETVAHQFLHAQLFSEMELSSLLARSTQWSKNPWVYARGTQIALPLWRQWWHNQSFLRRRGDKKPLFDGVAFGHALLAGIRITPVIPAKANELDPFVAALRRVDHENARMIQTQIRLLKGADFDLSVDDRERIILENQAVVNGAFGEFMSWLCDSA